MRRNTMGLALLSALAAASVASAQTQTQTQTQTRPPMQGTAPASPAVSGSDAARTDGGRSPLVEASALETGANSFTEAQARSRMEDAGFTGLQDLRKDDAGFWRGRAMRGGTMMDVALDFRGRIAAGPGVAQLGGSTPARTTSGATQPSTSTTQPGVTTGGTTTGGTTTGGTTTGARPDGTPGNPPSTMTGRAVDRMQGQTPQPDGTPGNPAGTAAGRAVDRATGTTTPTTPTR